MNYKEGNWYYVEHVLPYGVDAKYVNGIFRFKGYTKMSTFQYPIFINGEYGEVQGPHWDERFKVMEIVVNNELNKKLYPNYIESGRYLIPKKAFKRGYLE